MSDSVTTNPFLRYRHRLDSYEPVRDGRMTDGEFAKIIRKLDAAIEEVDGTGFVETPLVNGQAIADAIGLKNRLWIKVEVDNVGGSHKARHLMGVAIDMLVKEALGAPVPARLAIASCGNAAIGASVIAAAMDRPIDVFVPTWADAPTIEKLTGLGASINRCERREGESGDPAYLRFREAVENGSRAFSVQGTDTPTTFDGGRTLGWELRDQTETIGSLYVQVGGGALATSTDGHLDTAKLYPVQAEGCAPLRRAWDLLEANGFDWDDAAANPEKYMWAWDDPQSFATGILDDVTYDWLPLLKLTEQLGGEPIVAAESAIEQAYALAHEHTDIPVCSTGAAGLAGLLQQPPETPNDVVLLFTGVDRSQ